MIVNKRDGIPRSQLDNGIIEDNPQVVLSLLLMLHRKRDGVKAQKKSANIWHDQIYTGQLNER
jgi:hypothetical protein